MGFEKSLDGGEGAQDRVYAVVELGYEGRICR